MDEKKYLTVSALNNYIAYKLNSDAGLRTLYIKGEISNARFSKGHLYFVLKDDESEISAIMFANYAQMLSFDPEDGLKVLITASLSSYPKKGTYNLLVTKMEEFGKGLIYQRFIELKNKLSELGLFDESHKKKIPEFPNRIGIITSDNGDAIKDIISTINKRYPICEARVYKALVQGPDAPSSLVNAIELANKENNCDVLIIGRGGGAIEDLDCFNDPDLAYAIYNSNIPIVSGVGHENDFTICDFVSDFRAPTPTGAAVACTKEKSLLIEGINNIESRLEGHIKQKYLSLFNEYDKTNSILLANSPIININNKISELNSYVKRLELFNIDERINSLENEINQNIKFLNNNYNNLIKNIDNDFQSSIDKLILVNPLNIMKKGYTLVYKENKLIKTVNDININDKVNIKFSDGTVEANITNKQG